MANVFSLRLDTFSNYITYKFKTIGLMPFFGQNYY